MCVAEGNLNTPATAVESFQRAPDVDATPQKIASDTIAEHMPNNMNEPHDPSPILQAAFGFWSSKVLLTAVEFGLFTKLGAKRITGPELGRELGLHPRGVFDFLDALVAMKFLDREGNGPEARYFNTPSGLQYLDRTSPRYVGGILEML